MFSALSNTRGESRIEALTPLRYQIGQVYDGLDSLANLIKDYTFLSSSVIWYNVRLHIIVVSKSLQSIISDFTYEGEDEPVQYPTLHYKVEFYFHLLDIVIASLDERFTQLKSHSNSFDCLYDISILRHAQ
ncbi:hypothetical protein PR048_029949 [Dryococelus australis]|uniref:Uncharacterized protein n=1 Tax=Dryococelus australis TaxID=614101 RepID=A0ABQ9G7K1_9NEOP|nr:hypothetical protein PR048_029949 [Dryococelus australis]